MARSEAFEDRLMQEVARAHRHESIVSLVRFHVEGRTAFMPSQQGRRRSIVVRHCRDHLGRHPCTDEIGRVSDDGSR
ncbi:MAG: hypothetical protein R3E68_04330 [Burkholderiaceae bacterium]